ncbi:MAG: transcriptional regulator GcvA [Tagaea sp.]|nr:transcriptional regulator GcvA [Tagaea sp.]
MSRKLPPLGALRAFEAAARTGGFKTAAAELGVTPAAVSQQVAQLEAALGVALFRRHPRGVALTDSGAAFLPGLSDGFDRLAAAARALGARPRTGRIVISVLPGFATNWLVPRLPAFRRLYPEIDVHVRSDIAYVDFARDGVDLAIRYAKDAPAGLAARLLARETLFLAAAPALIQARPGLRRPSDLARATLIHDTSAGRSEPRLAWEPWLDLLGLPRDLAKRGPGFMDSSAIFQAVRLGQGVAVGRSIPLADDLALGRVVKLFGLELPSGFAYWIVHPQAAAKDSRVAAFAEWVASA